MNENMERNRKSQNHIWKPPWQIWQWMQRDRLSAYVIWDAYMIYIQCKWMRHIRTSKIMHDMNATLSNNWKFLKLHFKTKFDRFDNELTWQYHGYVVWYAKLNYMHETCNNH